MSAKTVLFNNTVLRDGHQSMAATRMTTAQMLPAAPILDEMGFHGLETWGGATIDSCLRYLNENPFDRSGREWPHAVAVPQSTQSGEQPTSLTRFESRQFCVGYPLARCGGRDRRFLVR